MSIPGRDSTAAMLAKAGFVVALALVNVSGFRPVLARMWHEASVRLASAHGHEPWRYQAPAQLV
jgi:hypothetical protein